MTIKFACEDKDALVAYLYDETTADERQAVELHLATCDACRGEVDRLRGVRADLTTWSPPEPDLGFQIVRSGPPARLPGAWWHRPAWGLGLAAAAMLVLAAAAALAHLEIRYDDRGIAVRTGWGAAAEAPATVTADATPWRQDLAALESRLRRDLRVTPAASVPGAQSKAAPGSVLAVDQTALLQRVSALIDQSESRQQRDLALRMAQLMRDIDQQRRTDWVRISQGFGRLEDLTGAGAVQQREVMNYLMRVSQRDQR